MKIAVCFKVIPDYDQVPSANWKGTGSVDFKYVKEIFGMFDEGALETARYYKSVDSSVELEAISFGKESKLFTEFLYSVGYQNVTYIDNENKKADPLDTAKTLAAYLKKKDFDLILTGDVVGPNESGSVPYHIAKELGIPLVDRVCDIAVLNGNTSLVRETDSEIEHYVVSEKALAVISNAKHAYLKIATFKEKEAAKEKPANKVSVGVAFKKDRAKYILPACGSKNTKYIDTKLLKEIVSDTLKEGANK